MPRLVDFLGMIIFSIFVSRQNKNRKSISWFILSNRPIKNANEGTEFWPPLFGYRFKVRDDAMVFRNTLPGDARRATGAG